MAHVRRIIPVIRPVVLLLAFACIAIGCGGGLEFDDDGRVKIALKDKTFWLEIADDTESIAIGLMKRDDIPADSGMIFVFPKPRVLKPGFYMKDCLVDIDLLFLDATGRVLRVYEMKKQLRRAGEQDSTYLPRLKMHPSDRTVSYAIEIRAGMLKELGIKARDKLDLDMEALKTLVKPADQPQ